MEDIYPAWQDSSNNDDRRSGNRLLRRLRIALLIWAISFVATVIWFSASS